MSNTYYSEEILGLKDIFITKVERSNDDMLIHLELQRKPHLCPACGTFTSKVHDYRKQKVKDIAILGNNTILVLNKRRYCCCNCKKRIPEENAFVAHYQRMTQRLHAFIISRFAEMRSAKSIAKECNSSVTTVIRKLDLVSFPLPKLPKVISIDEFKGNAGEHKFQCILTNPKKRTVLDILESRKLETLCHYFSQFDKGSKNNVSYVVMDMSGPFKEMARSVFPKAQIVVDKFHVCRHVTWALEKVRVRVQKSFGTSKRKYFKRSRWILLKRQGKLTEEEKQQLEIMLLQSEELRNAYLLKESFYEVMDSKDRESARIRLKKWNLYAGTVKVSEFEPVVNMICNWSKEILNAFETGYSNGFTEGMNNRIKVLKRVCYGVRNFERFRRRILYLQ